jgi:hypothetical protein
MDSQKKNRKTQTLNFSKGSLRLRKMSLFDKARRRIHSGTILCTPIRKLRFRVDYENDSIVLFKEHKERPFSKTPKVCWDGIPSFLKEQGKKTNGWVKIGTVFGDAEKGTFQDYVDRFHAEGKTHSTEAGHMASMLEHLGVIEVDHSIPSKIRLK